MKSHVKAKRRPAHARHAAAHATRRTHKMPAPDRVEAVKAAPVIDAPESQAMQASEEDQDTYSPIATPEDFDARSDQATPPEGIDPEIR